MTTDEAYRSAGKVATRHDSRFARTALMLLQFPLRALRTREVALSLSAFDAPSVTENIPP